MDTDFEPFGKVPHDGLDCSCGCRYFVKLTGELGNDCGVCANANSPRAGLLTFEHQGCAAFDLITVDHHLTDAQLRQLIGEASQILEDRRRQGIDLETLERPPMRAKTGEFLYVVRTSYSPHLEGHFPSLFRLELHNGEFTPVLLEADVSGNQRPTVRGRFSARNGDVFKIVRENGEYSYQIPLSGKIYNLKQGTYGLFGVGLIELEVLRPFFENVESEMFSTIMSDAEERVGLVRRCLEDSQDRVERWERDEFWSNEKPKNQRELRSMLTEERRQIADGPNDIAASEALLGWLKRIDRSNPRLKTIACPPVPAKRSRDSGRIQKG